MNNSFKTALNYLQNFGCKDIDEIELFIDDFNSQLLTYVDSGSSSYLLHCIDICLRLSDSIGYRKGIKETKLLRCKTLFNSGHFDVAHRSFSSIEGFNKSYTELLKNKTSALV